MEWNETESNGMKLNGMALNKMKLKRNGTGLLVEQNRKKVQMLVVNSVLYLLFVVVVERIIGSNDGRIDTKKERKKERKTKRQTKRQKETNERTVDALLSAFVPGKKLETLKRNKYQ